MFCAKEYFIVDVYFILSGVCVLASANEISISGSGSTELVPSPTTCGEAGFHSGCCSGGSCFVDSGNCYCTGPGTTSMPSMATSTSDLPSQSSGTGPGTTFMPSTSTTDLPSEGTGTSIPSTMLPTGSPAGSCFDVDCCCVSGCSDGQCFCDQACIGFGDCCDDFSDACGICLPTIPSTTTDLPSEGPGTSSTVIPSTSTTDLPSEGTGTGPGTTFMPSTSTSDLPSQSSGTGPGTTFMPSTSTTDLPSQSSGTGPGTTFMPSTSTQTDLPSEGTVPVELVEGPTNSTLLAGSSISLLCVARGNPEPEFQWFKDDGFFSLSSLVVPEANSVFRSFLFFTDLEPSDSGVYHCVASSEISDVAFLIVNEPVMIDLQPTNNITVLVSDSLDIFCTAVGVPKPSVLWNITLSNGSTFILNSEEETFLPGFVTEQTLSEINGTINVTSVLEITNITGNHNGMYICSGSNDPYGNRTLFDDSELVVVIVQSPPIVLPVFASSVLLLGNSVNFTFSIEAAEPAVSPENIMWTFNGLPIPSNDPRLSSDQLTITITNGSFGDEGIYTVIASNSVGFGQSSLELDVQVSPEVTVMSSVIVLENNTATFNCAVQADPLPTVQWVFRDAAVLNNTQYLLHELITAELYQPIIIILTLSVLDVQLSDQGVYSCEAVNVHGRQNDSTELFVQVPTQIIQGPMNVTEVVGEDVTLLCSARGNPRPSFTWIKDGQFFANSTITLAELVSALFRSMLLLPDLQISDAGIYQCMADNEVSAVAQLTVLEPAALTLFPSNMTANASDGVTFVCSAHGNPLPNITWQRDDGVELNFTMTSLFVNGSYTVSAVLELPFLDRLDSGFYSCTASNVISGITIEDTNQFLLLVRYSPVVVTHPESVLGLLGTTVTLHCSTEGFPIPMISWSKSNSSQPITRGDSVNISAFVNDAIAESYLTIMDIGYLDAANYSCGVLNTQGSTQSFEAELIVHAIVDLQPPANITVVSMNDSVILMCSASGVPLPSILWTRLLSNGTMMMIGQPITITEVTLETDGALNVITSMLEIASVTIDDDGVYTCNATNAPFGNGTVIHDSAQIVLSVFVVPIILPFFSSVVILLDSNISFTFAIDEAIPPVTAEDIVWLFNSSLLPLNDPRLSQDQLTITLTNISFADEGLYSVTASNLIGHGEGFLEVDVQSIPEVDLLGNGTFLESDAAILNCIVQADPIPTVQWVFNGTVLTNSTKHSIVVDSLTYIWEVFWLTSVTLTVSDIKISDQGSYSCVASNVHGMESRSTEFLVLVIPEIFDGPTNATNVVGESLLLSCSTRSNPEPTFLWFRNQQLFSNSSVITSEPNSTFRSTIMLENLQIADDGAFYCQAVNIIGSSTSDITYLTVNRLVSIIAHPMIVTLNTSETVSLECVAVGIPEPSISWVRLSDSEDLAMLNFSSTTNQINGSFIVVSTLVANSPFELGAGRFLCTAVNDVGNQELSIANVTFEVVIEIPPVVTAQSGSFQIGVAGGETAINCTAMAYPLPDIVWFFDNMTLPLDMDQFTVLAESEDDFTVTSTISILNLDVSNTGSYFCKAQNGLQPDDTSDFIQLLVQYPAEVSLDPLFVANLSEPLLLTCEAFGNPKPNITWFDNEDNIITEDSNDFNITVTEVSNISGFLVTFQLVIIEVNSSFEGCYTCVADNGIVNLINSTSSLSTEVVATLVPPQITTVPESVIGVIGQTITLQFVVVMAKPPVDVGDVVLLFDSDIRSLDFDFFDNQFSFNITTLAENDEGVYTLVATTIAGSGNASVYLDIQRPPVATVVPDNSSIIAGNQVTLECQVMAEPNSTIEWMFENSILTTGGRYDISYPGFLVINDISLSDAGLYSCNASNTHGFDVAVAVLTVQEPPQFTVQPDSNIASAVQSSTVISCSAVGFPAPSINWLFNGNILVSLSGNTSVQTVRPITSVAQLQVQDSVAESTLTLSTLSGNFTGNYHCEAYNDLVETIVVSSITAALQVQYPPNSISELLDSVLNESQSLVLSCAFTGIPLPVIIWTFTTASVSSVVDANVANISTAVFMDSELPAMQSTLFIRNVLKSNEGQYICQGVNDVANLIDAQDRVSANISIQVPPTIVPARGPFQDGVVTRDIVSGVAVLTFVITLDSPPVLSQDILWTYTDTVTGQDFDGDFLTQLSPRYTISNDRLSLTITNLSLFDNGTYTLAASNAAGLRNSTITFRTLAEPQIFAAPGSGNTTILEEGEDIAFSCSADGIPLPTITWLQNGILLQPDLQSRVTVTLLEVAGVRPNITTGIMSTLTISNLMPLSDIGDYLCRANSAGESDVLNIPFRLNITRRPVDHCSQSPCTNGGTCVNLPSGFLCQCHDEYTGTICDEEIISDEPAKIVKPPLSTFGMLYQTLNLTCESAGVPTPNISWFKDGVILPEERLPYLLITEIIPSKRGLYSCAASNIIRSPEDPNNLEVIKVFSGTAVVNINGIVQLTSRLLQGQLTQDVINQLNEILVGGELTQNSTILSLETLDTDDNTGALSVLITVLKDEETSNAQLREEVQLALQVAVDATEFNINFTSLQRFDGCPVEETIIPSNPPRSDLDITLPWPETDIGRTAIINCPCANLSVNSTLTAARVCSGNFNSGGIWDTPMQNDCNFTTVAREICQISNIEDTMEAVLELSIITEEVDNIQVTEVILTTIILETLTTDVEQNDSLALTESYLSVVDNLLEVDPELLQMSQEQSNTSARLLEAVESVAENVAFAENETNAVISLNTFAIIVQEVVQEEFMGQTFSVALGNQFDFQNNQPINTSALVVDNTDTSTIPLPAVTGSITIPSSIFDVTMMLPANISDGTRIIHSVFLSDALFLRRNQQNNSLQVGSIIIAASVFSPSVGDIFIDDLNPPIYLTFSRRPDLRNATEPSCNFWDATSDSGYGDWSQDGCQLINSTNDSVICECDHLTNFAILLDVSPNTNVTPPPEVAKTLESITFIGISVSIVCLVLTIITYLSTPKLRTSEAGQLVISLCFSFLGIYLSFVLAFFSPKVDGLCVFAGILVHYFLLTTFFIMAAEAINLYILLVIVIGRKIEKFVLKSMLIAWTLPVLIIIPCVAPDYHNYINVNFCRPYGVPFWAGLLAPFVIIYVFNWIMFLLIIVSLMCKNRHKEVNSDSKSKLDSKKHLTIVITLSILFGLGWGFGIPATQGISIIAVRTILQALFIILTSFQGLFIFIMQCLRSPIAREKWREWYYTVTCRHIEYKKRARGISTLNRSAQNFKTVRNKSSTLTTTAFDSATLRRVLESSTLQLNLKGSESEFTSVAADGPDGTIKSDTKSNHNLVLNESSDTEEVEHSLAFKNPAAEFTSKIPHEQYSELINELSDKLGSSVVSSEHAYNIVLKQKPRKQLRSFSIVFENAASEIELGDLAPVEKDQPQEDTVHMDTFALLLSQDVPEVVRLDD